MKKWSLKKRAKVAFWLLFALGCLWVALAPQIYAPPNGITVKVIQPPEPPAMPAIPGGEEQTPPAAVPPPEAGITIPVVPEKEETLAPGHKPKIAIVIDD